MVLLLVRAVQGGFGLVQFRLVIHVVLWYTVCLNVLNYCLFRDDSGWFGDGSVLFCGLRDGLVLVQGGLGWV